VELFSSLEAVRVAVTALVDIAQDYDLDGWLINIENTLPTECVENVILFLQLLTKEMREVRGVHSQVMWYDAVTMEGKLQWQDGLTALNKPFFDACDSIFINYTWKESSLVNTRCLLELEKGNVSRCSDVYYGVDVFGRGTIGGGGYNCCEALNLLDGVCKHPEISTLQSYSYSYSAAVFAPGWLLETQCTEVESTDCVYSK
jgi:mannosyl-glycoprotein endo-beta-N-acetylglucosaminidase